MKLLERRNYVTIIAANIEEVNGISNCHYVGYLSLKLVNLFQTLIYMIHAHIRSNQFTTRTTNQSINTKFFLNTILLQQTSMFAFHMISSHSLQIFKMFFFPLNVIF